MRKMIRILALCAAAVAVTAMPSPAFAVCSNSQPLQHGIGMFFTGCPDSSPVQGYAYVDGTPATNTSRVAAASVDIVCEGRDVDSEAAGQCQPEAGFLGDGNVTIQFNWQNSVQNNGAACPNPAGSPGVGRNVVQVLANDGSQVLLTVGYSIDFSGYILEMAHPGDGFLPIACSHDNGLTIVSGTPGVQANTFCVRQTTPRIYSDCDAGSGGTAFGNTCQGGTAMTPSVEPGNLYATSGPCAFAPDARRSQWQPLATTPGPNDSKCVVIALPPWPACGFIGGSSVIGGVETDALTGWLRIPTFPAAVDKVAIRKADLLQGRLRVDFATENEATIVGFNVYAGTAKLNSGLIAAKGQGSNDYSYEVGRGALKNERSITVEALLSDGTSVRSGPVAAN